MDIHVTLKPLDTSVHELDECHCDGQAIEDGSLNVENDNHVLLHVYIISILFSFLVYYSGFFRQVMCV